MSISRGPLPPLALALALSLIVTAGNARAWPTCRGQPLPAGTPAELGAAPGLRGDLDALLADAVARKVTQSIAVVVARRGKVLYRGAAGGARPDSIFDLASVTKVVATTPAVMQLVERRKVTLDAPLGGKLPFFAGADKRAITARQCFMHTTGLHSVVWAGKETDTRPMILARLKRSRMRAAPGARYRYSDLGYIALGELVERISGKRLDRYARDHLFKPLGMCDTGFAPPRRLLPRVISPWPGGEKPGQVYDPMAARMAGVAGHTGLYATADDLARFGQMMLGGGALGGERVLEVGTVLAMTRGYTLPGDGRHRRGLGWDKPNRTARGSSTRMLSGEAFGHTGFTGTSLWIDPAHQLVVVLLTNRTFYEPAPSVVRLRARLHGLVVAALDRPPRRRVTTGLDRLVATGFAALRGRKVGLITNSSAVDGRGRWIVDLLTRAPDVQLVALFAPEHGLRARLDQRIRDGALRRAGRRIPVYSLFGGRRRPTEQTLAGVDTLVFDVAAVGVRFYTYLSTMGQAMEEAARRKLRFVVLDRPDPSGGAVVQGPLATDRRRSSTNYHPLPVRYGMTMGELARMYNRERRIGVKLEVVRLGGWRRGQRFNETGLRWVNPSPNIRSWRQALLYGGVGLLEGTNLAVGRGTDAPFLHLGAPWIDGPALARELDARRVAGVHVVPTSFTPSSSRYKGERCHGVRLLLLDPARLDPPALGVAIALALRKLHPDRWDPGKLFRLVRHPPTTRAILAGTELRQILPLWRPGLARFSRARRRYLLYR